MKVFRIQDGEREDFFGIKADAKRHVHTIPPHRRDKVLVSEIEVQTDKEGVIAMLNEEPLYKVLRTFGVTPRGAFKEEKD